MEVFIFSLDLPLPSSLSPIFLIPLFFNLFTLFLSLPLGQAVLDGTFGEPFNATNGSTVERTEEMIDISEGKCDSGL